MTEFASPREFTVGPLRREFQDEFQDAVSAREAQFNTALAEVCASLARCRWDGGATFGYAFTAKDVSTVDYFHPSVTGQASLAGVSWPAGYWGAP